MARQGIRGSLFQARFFNSYLPSSTARDSLGIQQAYVSLARLKSTASKKPTKPTALNVRVKSTQPVRLAATWLLADPEKADYDRILDQIPALVEAPPRRDTSSSTTVFFLATPKVAQLFEPGSGFHSSAVNGIFGPRTRRDLRLIGPPRSIVAVVDALPAISSKANTVGREVHGYEGLAVCITPDLDISSAAGTDPGYQPLVTLVAPPSGQAKTAKTETVACYTAPVANTLFANGQLHTFFETRWDCSDSGQYIERSASRTDLSEVKIPLYRFTTSGSVRTLAGVLSANLNYLTSPAVIASSMGNILRQVRLKDGRVASASHDLESTVPKFAEDMRQKFGNVDVQVFALVYPPAEQSENPGSEDSDDLFRERVFFGDGRGMKLSKDALLNLLQRGGRLHRVTSGGAGWGKSAGSLSLEPKTKLNQAESSSNSFSFMTELLGETSSPEQLETPELLPPGHVVQFIASYHDPEGSSKDAPTISQMQRRTLWLRQHFHDSSKLQKFCVGTMVPRAKDAVNIHPLDENSESDTERIQLFVPNQFGFLSTSPMCITSTTYPRPSTQASKESGTEPTVSAFQSHGMENESNAVHSTLIEVPNSKIVATFQAGGEREIAPQPLGDILRDGRIIQSSEVPIESLVSASDERRGAVVNSLAKILGIVSKKASRHMTPKDFVQWVQQFVQFREVPLVRIENKNLQKRLLNAKKWISLLSDGEVYLLKRTGPLSVVAISRSVFRFVDAEVAEKFEGVQHVLPDQESERETSAAEADPVVEDAPGFAVFSGKGRLDYEIHVLNMLLEDLDI